MRYDRTTDPDTFAARLVALPLAQHSALPVVHVTERDFRGRWLLCATVRLGAGRMLLLEATVGHRLALTVPSEEAWPTHAHALAQVRDAVGCVVAAASDAGLACVVTLPVSAAVLAERPPEADRPIPTSGGRRLGAVLAWTKRRAA